MPWGQRWSSHTLSLTLPPFCPTHYSPTEGKLSRKDQYRHLPNLSSLIAVYFQPLILSPSGNFKKKSPKSRSYPKQLKAIPAVCWGPKQGRLSVHLRHPNKNYFSGCSFGCFPGPGVNFMMCIHICVCGRVIV